MSDLPLVSTLIIYGIRNTKTGAYYIGRTQHLARRWWSHRYWLRQGNHKNKALQLDWNRYGAEGFTPEILATYKDVGWDDSWQVELAWIRDFVSKGIVLYNVPRPGWKSVDG